jgi:hypothetical protein
MRDYWEFSLRNGHTMTMYKVVLDVKTSKWAVFSEVIDCNYDTYGLKKVSKDILPKMINQGKPKGEQPPLSTRTLRTAELQLNLKTSSTFCSVLVDS